MSKPFEVEGTLKVLMEPMTFQGGFRKREFVVTEEDERYPQDIKFAVVQNNCALLDSFKPGDKVRVTFSLRGNLYKDRYYTDLQAFKIERLDVDGSSSEPIPQPPEDFVADTVTDDDMPF